MEASQSLLALSLVDVDFLPLQAGLDDAGVEKAKGIIFDLIVEKHLDRSLGSGGMSGIEPEANGRESKTEKEDRSGDAIKTHPAAAEGGDFLIGRKSAKGKQDGGKEGPGNGENEGVGQELENEDCHKRDRSSFIHEEIVNLLKNVSEDEHHAEHHHREEGAHQNLSGEVAVDLAHHHRSQANAT